MEENVMASMFVLLIPKIVSIWSTIVSMLLSTIARLFALKTMLKPTFRLLWHFHPVLV